MPQRAWSDQRERQYEPIEGGLKGRAANDRTRKQLYDEARERGIEGRSKMNKAQLERAVG